VKKILLAMFLMLIATMALGIEYNAKDNGAVGDGIADDTVAIQKTIDKAVGSSIPGIVYLPSGDYKITSPLVIKDSGIIFRGEGRNQTRIHVVGNVNGINVIETNSNIYLEAVVLRDFRIAPTSTNAGTGINITGMRHMSIERVWVGGWYNNTVGFEKGIYCDSNPAYYLTVSRCILMRNRYGIYLAAGANDARIDSNDIWYGDYSIYVDGAAAPRITNNTCEAYGKFGTYVKDTDNAYVGFN
jgi:hypothetical protein